LIRGPFETHDIVGGHDGMFREPYVGVLGTMMKDSLAQAQQLRGNQEPAVPLPANGSAQDRVGRAAPRPKVAGGFKLESR
jgi:hypothetical protein